MTAGDSAWVRRRYELGRCLYRRFNAQDASGFDRLYAEDAVFTMMAREGDRPPADQREPSPVSWMAGLKMRGKNVSLCGG